MCDQNDCTLEPVDVVKQWKSLLLDLVNAKRFHVQKEQEKFMRKNCVT